MRAETPTYRTHMLGRRKRRRRGEFLGPTARRAFGYAALAVVLALALLYLPLSWPEAPQPAFHPPAHGPAYPGG